jgi:hypothetical protein
MVGGTCGETTISLVFALACGVDTWFQEVETGDADPIAPVIGFMFGAPVPNLLDVRRIRNRSEHERDDEDDAGNHAF